MDDWSIAEILEHLNERTTCIRGAAVYLETHPSYVRRLIEKGILIAYKVGVHTLLDLEDLRAERKAREWRRERAQRRKLEALKKAEQYRGYEGWTVKDLMSELRHRELPIKGRKADLISRLEASDEEELITHS